MTSSLSDRRRDAARTAELASVLRGLELTVMRKLDGILQGDYHGLLPGQGSEPGEARVYVPGDDVRRIDWNVTARTGEPHVRDTIADRELEVTVVADLSGSMEFGTAQATKRDLAVAGAAAVGFLVQRGGNRVGAIVSTGSHRRFYPHRSGRAHLQAVLHALLDADGRPGRVDIAKMLREAGRVARRRGLVVVVSDFLDTGDWQRPLRLLGRRHDVVAIEVVDPRELEIPDVGVVTLEDPETGRRRWVDTRSESVRVAYRAAAAEQRLEIRRRLTTAGVDRVQLRTDRDWVKDIVAHVALRRRGVTTGRRP